jgi:moderate conductance mechanosensitive channel
MDQVDSLIVAMRQNVRTEWGDLFNLPVLAATGLRMLGAVFVGWLIFALLKLALRRVERSIGEPTPGIISLQEQRARTIVGLLRSAGIVVIVLITFFMMLGALGMDVRPLLAGAGVIGLAISFGAQSLVKDVIAGLFMLFENQFGVGDVVRIGDTGGLVEKMTLRVVVLRDIHGTVHVIPNGEIKTVSNLTRTWARAVLDVGVAYKEDADRVIALLREIGEGLWEDEEWQPLLIDKPEVPGIQEFSESSVDIRFMVKTLPLKQWDVARELRRRIKKRFDAEGVEIPFPHRTFYWGEGQMPRIPAGAAASGDTTHRERNDGGTDEPAM